MSHSETTSVAGPGRKRDRRDYFPPAPPPGPVIDYSGPDRGSGLSQWLDYAKRIAGVDSEPWETEAPPDPGFDDAWSEEYDDPYALTEEEGEVLDLMDQYNLDEAEAWVLRERLLQWAEGHQFNDLDDSERHLAETLRLMRTGLLEAEADRHAAAKIFGRSTSVAVKRPTVTTKRKPVLGKEPEWFRWFKDLSAGRMPPPDPDEKTALEDLNALRIVLDPSEIERRVAELLRQHKYWSRAMALRYLALVEEYRETMSLSQAQQAALRVLDPGVLEREAKTDTRPPESPPPDEASGKGAATPSIRPRRRARVGGLKRRPDIDWEDLYTRCPVPTQAELAGMGLSDLSQVAPPAEAIAGLQEKLRNITELTKQSLEEVAARVIGSLELNDRIGSLGIGGPESATGEVDALELWHRSCLMKLRNDIVRQVRDRMRSCSCR